MWGENRMNGDEPGSPATDRPSVLVVDEVHDYILDCADLDAALRYAAMIPSAKYGSVEVRPVMVMGPH